MPSKTKASIPRKPTIAAIPDTLWGPAVAAVGMAIVGIAGLLAGMPLLLPSLGPTDYLQANSPANPDSRFYNTVIGHMMGIAMGLGAVLLVGAYDDPVVLQAKVLTGGRVAAAVLAVMLTLAVTFLLRATHPPAGASTLLVALGSIKTTNDILALVLGVVVMAAAGELFRRVRIGRLFTRVRGEPRLPEGAGR